jgi:hypothetical protein
MTIKGWMGVLFAVAALSACGKNSHDEAVPAQMDCAQYSAFVNSGYPAQYTPDGRAMTLTNYQGQRATIGNEQARSLNQRCFGMGPYGGFPQQAPPPNWNQPRYYQPLPPQQFPPPYPVYRHDPRDPRYGWNGCDRVRDPDCDHDRDLK